MKMVEDQTEPINEEKQEEATVKVPEFKKPLDKMTAIELKEVAKEIPGVTGVHAMKKEDLLNIIKEYYGIEEETPSKGKKKMVQKQAVSVKELKAKIVELRGKKAAVQGSKDRKQANILRRRINRLKKQTRKAAQA